MRFLGFTGFVVVFTVIFGEGHGLKLALLTVGMSVFLLTSLYSIVESIPREEFDHARTLRMGPWRTTFEVVVYGRLDAVLDAIRQNGAMGLVLLAFAEGFVRYEGGLFVSMLNQDKHMRMAFVVALQLTVLVIGIVQDGLFLFIRRMLCPYASISLERK